MVPADVVVVGAGPAGLTLAAGLARQGVRVRLLDRDADQRDGSRAVAVQSRSLEVFEDLGVLHEAMRRGRRIERLQVWEQGARVVALELDQMGGPYPFLLALPQFETEALLEERVRAWGVVPERGTSVVGIEQDDYGAEVAVEVAGRRQRIRASWVVACDGALSTVRGLLGVEPAHPDSVVSVAVADLPLKGPVQPDTSHFFLAPGGLVALVPMPGDRWRLMVEHSAQPLPHALDRAWFEARVDERAGGGFRLGELHWAGRYAVRPGVASRWRVGRVFLAGDAAHVHSPVGGQGMNAGIQDAHNLAWKLGLVVRGVGQSRLLDSYEPERAPVAEELRRHTGQVARLAQIKAPVMREVRSGFVRALGALGLAQERIALTLGEVDVSYRQSPIVGESRARLLDARWTEDRSQESPSLSDWRDFGHGPRAGDRAPDGHLLKDGALARLHSMTAGGRHTLLLFDGEAPTAEGYQHLSRVASEVLEAYGSILQVWVVVPGESAPEALVWRQGLLLDPEGEVHRRYAARAECLYLIRPDGYIGFRAQPADLDALRLYLASLFV